MKNKHLETWIELIIIILLCEGFFFRNILFTSGAMIGDAGDGLFTNLVTEHWYKFLIGKEGLTDLPIFYPTKGTLAYSDMLLGFGIPHTILRLLGMNMFLAFKCTLIFTHFIGSVATCYLLKEKFKCNDIWSLIGTIAFSYSDTYGYTIRHTQLMAIAYVPILVIFLVGFFTNLQQKKKRNLYAVAAIITAALMAYTSWYIFFFTGLFALIFIIVYVIKLLMYRISFIKPFFETVKEMWKSIICYIVGGVAIMIPFLLTYYPVFKDRFNRPELPQQSYRALYIYLPEIADLVNVRDTNLLFGTIPLTLELSHRGISDEVITGFSIVLLVLFVLSIIYIHLSNRKCSDREKDFLLRLLLLDELMVSVIIGVLLTIRLSSNGVSLWFFIHYHIPGARSVRAVARFLFFLSHPMSVAIAACGNDFLGEKKGKGFEYFGIVIMLLMLVSNVNLAGVNSEWNYLNEISELEQISKPGKDISVFYVSNGKVDQSGTIEETLLITFQQTKAYEIAEWFGLKTVNGYSGNFPKGWGITWFLYGEEYEKAIKTWGRDNNISHLYKYDLSNDVWEIGL